VALATLLEAFIPLAEVVESPGAMPLIAEEGKGYKAALALARSINASAA
jgi:hypothetical protein